MWSELSGNITFFQQNKNKKLPFYKSFSFFRIIWIFFSKAAFNFESTAIFFCFFGHRAVSEIRWVHPIFFRISQEFFAACFPSKQSLNRKCCGKSWNIQQLCGKSEHIQKAWENLSIFTMFWINLIIKNVCRKLELIQNVLRKIWAYAVCVAAYLSIFRMFCGIFEHIQNAL